MAKLSAALKATMAESKKHVAARQAAQPEPQSGTSSRAKKVQLSMWLEPEFKRSLQMVKVQKLDASLEDLHAEALNELFAKYNVPTVQRVRKKSGDFTQGD